MRCRSLPLLAGALLLMMAMPADAARRRSVRTASLGCSYSIAPSISTPMAQDGVSRLQIAVQGVTSQCSTWSAWSNVTWITIEVTATDVFLTLAPNPTDQPRSAIVTIAGQPYDVSQLGRTNLLVNGTFDDDILPWGWNSFPNSSGSASWSALDSQGDSSSGSIRLRDSKTGDQAFQRMQCVNATPGVYDYGFSVRSELPETTLPVMAFLNFTGPDCTGTYPAYSAKVVTADASGVWERRQWLGKLTSGHQSIMIVIGAYARQPGATQEVWIDEVFVRPSD